jgi:hypothetical protein
MKVKLSGSVCRVEREPNDPRFRSESQLLHRIKIALNKQGFDLIKKRMWKDGHLVSEHVQYLRAKSPKSPCLAIWNERYQIEDAGERFNTVGKIELQAVQL